MAATRGDDGRGDRREDPSERRVGLGICGTLGEVAWARAILDGDKVIVTQVGSAAGDPRELAGEIDGAHEIIASSDLLCAAPWQNLDASSIPPERALERLLDELLDDRIVLCSAARKALGEVRSKREDGRTVADVGSVESYPAVAVAFAVLALDAAPLVHAAPSGRSRYRLDRGAGAIGGIPIMTPAARARR